jgi:hypothetical protein
MLWLVMVLGISPLRSEMTVYSYFLYFFQFPFYNSVITGCLFANPHISLMTSKTNYPEPPPGYQPALKFEYPKLNLQLLAGGLIIVITPCLVVLTWLLQGRPGQFPLPIQPTFGDLMIVLATIIITILVHELIHGLVYQLLGYKVSYGVSLQLMAAYAGAFGQWQQRRHNILVALAPLVLLPLLLIPLLSVSQPTLVLIAFTALLFNTGGAVGDLYLVWRLLHWPATSLLYDVNTSTMLVFLPVTD